MKLLATISSALAGSPGIDFYLNDGNYWPVLACGSDKGCSAWKITTKPGWENSWAKNLKCDLEIEKCTCADDWVDLDNDPNNGCEAPAGLSVFGDRCYYSSCIRDDKCAEFHPGLVCSAVTGCCECEGELPVKPTWLGQSTGCLDKDCPEGARWDPELKWCVCDDGSLPWYNNDMSHSVCCPPGTFGYNEEGNPCRCPDGSEPNPDSADPCGPSEPEDCPEGQVLNPETGACECEEGWYDTQAFAAFLHCCPEGSVFMPGAASAQCVCPEGTFQVSVDPFKCCPEGLVWNPELKMCDEPGEHCPPGTWHVAGTSPPMCCKDGEDWDPEKQQCIDSPPCPEGTYLVPLDDGTFTCCPLETIFNPETRQCEDPCPEGEYFVPNADICCPNDTIFNFETRQCEPKDPVECPPGSYPIPNTDPQQCCKDGEVWDVELDKCTDGQNPCADGDYLVPGTDICCPNDTFLNFETRQCEPKDPCPEGEYLVPGTDICCPNETFLNFETRECEPKDPVECPPGSYPIPNTDPLQCCKDGEVWDVELDKCTDGQNPCADGDYLVPGTDICCPNDTFLNFETRECEPKDPVECPPGSYPIPNTDPLQCCKDGEIWDVEQDKCTDGQNPCPPGTYAVTGTMPVACCPFETFFNPETRECDQGKCPDGSYPIAGTNPVMCCDIGTYWNPVTELCDDPNDPTDPIEECPKGFYQVAGVMPLQCCPDGSRWIPEMRECICPDETLPVAGQYPACGEPDVCPPGEYPALLEPEIICCPKGTKYDVASGLCLCPDETPVDDMGLCTECPDGFYAALRFPELVCCPENTWYEGQMRECLCPDMTKPDENGVCVDPTDKCDRPYKYDFNTGNCVCWNGMEPIRGDPSIPVDEFGCFPSDCLEGENAFYDKEDNLVCCRDGLVYNHQKDMCVCKDGNLPTATGDCSTCEKWENAFFIEDKIICCGVNQFFNAGHNHCMCTDGSHDAECPFPCRENEIHELDYSGLTAGECIPMCEDGHVFNMKTKTCTCPDGRPIVEGYPGGCPPVTVECELFFLPWDTLMGTICCHEEAHYNRELDQCVCNDGSRPDARGFCGKSCPEELVYAPYPPTGEFACLCPETLKFPNADGICMENSCEKPLNPFQLPDGSVACCPAQSYFDIEKRSCICLSTKQPPNDVYVCPDKCPEDTVPVFDAETGELMCLAVDCAPGFYLAYAEICCRNDMKFDRELFMCTCPLGLSDIDGKCIKKCSYGSTWDGQDCVSKCPEGQIYRNEKCYCALDGSLASRDKPCCKFGESWDAEKGICTCDGDLFCEKPCPEERPNLFLDKFGDRQCCKPSMNFDVVVHFCMCNPLRADQPSFKPLDDSCTCPDGQRQMMSADGTFFSCIDAGCVNGLVFDERTGMCACPEDSWQFWNSIGIPVCCKRDQKWSEELQECICHETNLPANDDGECEDLGDERCPPGWTYIKEMVSFFGEPVRCMPICPEPSIVYVKPIDEVAIGGIAATVECMCKGDARYNGTTDNMIDYILYGACEIEECPPGLVRSDDILTFNECTCPYKWQQLIQTASIPPQLMCTCDDEKYEINQETGMCECKRSVAEFQIFGLDGSCDCPRHMRYNVENDACEEISTGTVIDIDENCWYYDFELESCLSKDEFDDQFAVKPTENPFDQNKEECPGFEVGWKGLKSSKINYKSPTGYLIHVNVLNNQNNVDVTVEDYIGFLIFSKRYCGIEFIKELDNGNVKIDFFDRTDAYDKSEVYVRLDKAQSQTVVQFTTNHARDEAGNPDLHLATAKKDQFLVHIKFENEIEFLYGAENCLTRFNIGVMKSEMDFTADYTHCVANTLWWTAPVIEE